MGAVSDVMARKAEEDVHVDEELERARKEQGLGEPVTIEQVKSLLEDTDAHVGGVESTAAMMIVYNRYDGVPSQITTDQAGQRLRVRFEPLHPMAGQLVWTTKPPDTPPSVGTLLCPLHPGSEEREYLDGLHFEGKTCAKSTLKTRYDRDMHFEKGHRAIFAAVEKDKDRQLQVQQMDLMKQQTAAMERMADRGTDSPAQPIETPPQAITDECPDCDYTGTQAQLNGHKSIHNRGEAATS